MVTFKNSHNNPQKLLPEGSCVALFLGMMPGTIILFARYLSSESELLKIACFLVFMDMFMWKTRNTQIINNNSKGVCNL